MMYVGNIFNADPHPGNLFVRAGRKRSTSVSFGSDNGSIINRDYNGGNGKKIVGDDDGFTIVLLDWGLAKRLTDVKRLAFCQLVYAAATFDFGLMMDSFDTMGLRLKRENVMEDMEGVRFLLRDMAPKEKSRKRIKAKMKVDRDRFDKKKKGERVPVESKAYPGEFFFFVRVNELLHGLGSKLGVEVNYLDILKPYAEYGLTMSQEKNTVGHYSPSISNPGSEESLEWKIMCAIKKFEDKGQITGSQVCVVDGKGQTLANVVSGHLGGLKQNVSMSADTLVFGWSVTKAVSATLAHLMVQEGYLTYDEPICQRVWPAFCPSESAPEELFRSSMVDMDDSIRRWSWKRRITLRHILTHSSGMWSSLPRNSTIEKISSCEKCCAAFEFDVNLPGDTLLLVAPLL